MIEDWNRICRALSRLQWRPTAHPTDEKIKALMQAIREALVEVSVAILQSSGRVHLAYSGGVDSTLLLYLLHGAGVPITAHTLVGDEDHPDLTHARKVLTSLGVNHTVHIRTVTPEDVTESNRVLNREAEQPDNYYLLMRAIAPHSNAVVCGDCIDELLGGYYAHRGPDVAAFHRHMNEVVPKHLQALHRCSQGFGVTVYEPYANKKVLVCCRAFAFPELADQTHRKMPMYKMAEQVGVPSHVILRKKMGLVSAV